jgi:tripeptidyl-peptidase-1
MIAPKDESSMLVMNWLADNGLSRHAALSARGDSVLVEASIAQVEKLLGAEYAAFGKTYQFIKSSAVLLIIRGPILKLCQFFFANPCVTQNQYFLAMGNC